MRRVLIGEDLAQVAFIRIGHLPVGKDMVKILVIRVTGRALAAPIRARGKCG